MSQVKTNQKYNVKVKARPNESIDSLLAKFKKKMNEAGILDLYREKQYYEKPTDKRRRKLSKSIYDTQQRINRLENQ